MAFEIDHLFICTEVGAPEAEQLRAFGLTEGRPNTHPGQGTACRRFFFENAYLELLWVHSPGEAQSKETRPTRLWERWSKRTGHACPFGICIRPGSGQPEKSPFSAWEYRPSYLPPATCISIAHNAEAITEPMLFYPGFGQRPDAYTGAREQPLNHPAGLRKMTRVRLVTPCGAHLSPELKAMTETRQIEFQEGKRDCLEIGFDGERQGKMVDFRPGLPLVFRW